MPFDIADPSNGQPVVSERFHMEPEARAAIAGFAHGLAHDRTLRRAADAAVFMMATATVGVFFFVLQALVH